MLSVIGIVLVLMAVAGVIGFAGGIAMSVHAYEQWERIVLNEHRHEIRRVTEASTEMATEADRVISASRAALASLRSQLASCAKEPPCHRSSDMTPTAHLSPMARRVTSSLSSSARSARPWMRAFGPRVLAQLKARLADAQLAAEREHVR